MTKSKRVNIRGILADPDLRRKLMVATVQATQAREGIETTKPQAERAYYVVNEREKTVFFDLEKYRATKNQIDHREEMFIKALREVNKEIRVDVARRDFASIEGTPLAFQSIALIAHFFRDFSSLSPSFAETRVGHQTFNDERFVRMWWEVYQADVGTGKKWTPFAKGGEFSRFYSDIYLVVRWDKEAHTIYSTRKSNFNVLLTSSSSDYLHRSGLTWPSRTVKGFNIRYLPEGCVFAHKGPALFPKDPNDKPVIAGVLNSSLVQYIMLALTNFSWEVGVVQRVPFPKLSSGDYDEITNQSNLIYEAKAGWDAGNEVSTQFCKPWIFLDEIFDSKMSVSERLNHLIEYEIFKNSQIQETYAELNRKVYSIYNVPDSARQKIEESLGERPLELIWPQMEGKDTDQKRMEHVWRLLSYVVKRVIEADADGIVPILACAGETSLLERVQQEVAELFPNQDITQVEVAIVNELKRKVKGYRRTESIQEWLETVYFDYHTSLYKKRPIFWHIASAQAPNSAAFGVLVHYHRFDHNRLAKLRSHYLRDAIDLFRREAALAGQEGRADDRLDWQTRLEEAETLEQRLKWVQEGYHEGAEDGSTDYRILTPWKSPAERPNGWNPDLDDGVAVNIAPLQKAGVLRIPKVV